MKDEAPRPPAPPRLRQYLALVAGVWVFLAFQTWLLSLMLGSARGLILFALFLGGGFLTVALFDYFWLRRNLRG